jgi:hypothetical protein
MHTPPVTRLASDGHVASFRSAPLTSALTLTLVTSQVAKLKLSALRPEDQRRVRWLNRDDLLLYAEAKVVFRRRLAAYGIPQDVKC